MSNCTYQLYERFLNFYFKANRTAGICWPEWPQLYKAHEIAALSLWYGENDENSDAIILSAFNLWLCLDNTTGL